MGSFAARFTELAESVAGSMTDAAKNSERLADALKRYAEVMAAPPSVVPSSSGAYGLWQIAPFKHPPAGAFDPTVNALAALRASAQRQQAAYSFLVNGVKLSYVIGVDVTPMPGGGRLHANSSVFGLGRSWFADREESEWRAAASEWITLLLVDGPCHTSRVKEALERAPDAVRKRSFTELAELAEKLGFAKSYDYAYDGFRPTKAYRTWQLPVDHPLFVPERSEKVRAFEALQAA